MKSITLDQLVAFNDEIAALVRAGVPLDRGLIQLSQDLPGRLGRLAAEIGRRMEAGESLSHVVSQSDSTFPPHYAAVAEAGIRSGRLTIALEGLSSSMRNLAELRRMVCVAFVYPIALLGTAYAVFLFASIYLMPVMVDGYREFAIDNQLWAPSIARAGAVLQPWWYLPPIIFILVLALCWYRAGRPGRFSLFKQFAGRLPTLGNLLQSARLAAFAEVLRLLIKNDVPLSEAIPLAADATGDRKLRAECCTLAERLQSGERLCSDDLRRIGFSPLLSWILVSARDKQRLAESLQHLSTTLRARVTRMSNWLLAYLPVVLAAGIGGTVSVVLAIAILGPWYHALLQMSEKF